MNYKDLVGLYNPNFDCIAIIDQDACVLDNKRELYIYHILSFDEEDYKAICSVGIGGAKEVYDIRTLDSEDYLTLINNNEILKVAPLNKAKLVLEMVGQIKDNKIYCDFYGQGHIYKNEIIFRKTINLSDQELDKLLLEEKICYIPESYFNHENKNNYIDLNDMNLEDNYDYCTVKTIRHDIENYYGSDIMDKIDDRHKKEMIEEVFYTVDWQHPYSLIEGDQYLDGYVEETLGISLDDGCER